MIALPSAPRIMVPTETNKLRYIIHYKEHILFRDETQSYEATLELLFHRNRSGSCHARGRSGTPFAPLDCPSVCSCYDVRCFMFPSFVSGFGSGHVFAVFACSGLLLRNCPLPRGALFKFRILSFFFCLIQSNFKHISDFKVIHYGPCTRVRVLHADRWRVVVADFVLYL